MSSVKIKMAGPLTTIQDKGRIEYQQSGMSVSGVMDDYSFRAANLLVGNQETEAVLECTLLGPTMEFTGDAVFAVTGATAQVKVNGQPSFIWRAIRVKAGDTVSFSMTTSGTRLYIAFAGGIDVPEVMGSKSTYMKAKVGGFEGRNLKVGDELQLSASEEALSKIVLKEASPRMIPSYYSEVTLRAVLGPQDDCFTKAGINTFFGTPYQVTSDSDRMGYRLEGAVIEHKKGGDIISDGIVIGAVQVPGNGKPIILMADRQTTGGYTKIATVITADLPLVGQMRPGSFIRFQKVTVEEAQQVLKEYADKIKIFKICMLNLPG